MLRAGTPGTRRKGLGAEYATMEGEGLRHTGTRAHHQPNRMEARKP